MNINQIKLSAKSNMENNASVTPIATLDKAAVYLQNMIELGIGEIDEEKLKEKYDATIQTKLQYGKRLTAEELRYLKKYNPIMYAHAMRIETKRCAVEQSLKNANSKQEVEEIQFRAMSTINKKDPVKEYMVAAVQDAVKEFKKTSAYKSLPEVEEKDKKNKKAITYEFGTDSYQIAFEDKGSETIAGFTAIS